MLYQSRNVKEIS